MKIVLILLAFSSSAFAHSTKVHSYERANGTYVDSYERSQRDNNSYNNKDHNVQTQNPYAPSENTYSQPAYYNNTNKHSGGGWY